MLVVLADDFSGAAEMGGIAKRYGLLAEIQMEPVIHSNADILVIDTNTRSLNDKDAVGKILQVAGILRQFPGSFRLFKKVDSVMRGHIVAEIAAIQQELGYDRALLLPANPGRGRKIISGHYYINGKALDKTVFGSDPDFPINNSSVESLLMPRNPDLHYSHIQQNDDLPSLSLITGDAETKNDLKNYLARTNEKDLCCGAAECFEAWLENLGYTGKEKTYTGSDNKAKLPFTLIINGSTVKESGENEEFKRLNLPELSIPGRWEGDYFCLTEDEEISFRKNVLDLLNTFGSVVVTIDHPVKHLKKRADLFSGYFIKLIHYISGMIGKDNLHFCLTGGATSFAIMNSTGIRAWEVKEEISPGIVTLKSHNAGTGLFTVKPGSYPWPHSFLENLVQ